MAERTEPIRQDLDATRSSMSETLGQIEGQVREKVDATVSQAKRAVDVRHQVAERPWLSLGAAVAIGYVLGSLGGESAMPQRPRPGEPMRYYPYEGQSRPERPRSEPHEERRHEERPYAYAQRPSGQRRGGQTSGVVAQIAEPMRAELTLIATAAVRSAIGMLRNSLCESIPQFEREYHAAQQARGDQAGAEAQRGGEVRHEGADHSQARAGRREPGQADFARERAVGGDAGTVSGSGMLGGARPPSGLHSEDPPRGRP